MGQLMQGARERTRPGRNVRMVLLVLAGSGALAALLGLAAHFWTPHGSLTLGLTAAAPYLMLGAPIALVLIIVARQWMPYGVPVIVAGALLAGCLSTQAPLYVATSPPPRDAHRIVVMTANPKLGAADPDAVVAAVRRHEVDVLMLEELTTDEQQKLITAGLDRALGHHESEPRGSAGGTGLWSRYPLVGARHVAGFTFAFIVAGVRIPGVATTPTFVALHMGGPIPQSRYWQRDIHELPARLRALPSSAPVVVGGDFNATPDTRQFRRVLAAGYADAAGQAGAGVTRTYPANRWFPPLIAIDHVLTRDAVATAADTVQLPGTDHRALVTTVALPRS